MQEAFLNNAANAEAVSISSSTAAGVKRYQGTVMVTATTACWARCSQNAASNALSTGVDTYLVANWPYTFNVNGYISFITSSAAGSAYICPV